MVQFISQILTENGYVVYTKMPSFSQGAEPELYLVVTQYDSVKARNDGRIQSIGCNVTVAIIGTDETAAYTAKNRIINILEQQGVYYRGTAYSSDLEYPQQFRRDMEFYGVKGVE